MCGSKIVAQIWSGTDDGNLPSVRGSWRKKLPTLTALLHNRTLRVAVTGLSQSGKTAFITSLVHNIVGTVGRPGRLPFLRAAAEQRIVATRVLAPEDHTVGRFPLEQNVAALAADPPHWPPSTTDLRQVRLVLRFSPGGLLGRRSPIGSLARGSAELRIEIVDYPGEWLLDLPLLRQSYAEWSRVMLDLARRGVRPLLARDWLDLLARHPADSAGDLQTARQAHDLYRDFLAACREREQLSFLQPGRFLNRGQATDASVLWFCPMPLPVDAQPRPGSLAAIMEARFEAYKRVIVQPFFEQLGRDVDRQIVLVDVLQ